MAEISKDSLLFGLPSSHSRHTYIDLDSGHYSKFVFTDNRGLLLRSKNENAKKAFQELKVIDSKGLRNKDFQVELLKFFQFVLDNRSSFDLIEDRKEVYWEFCVVQGNNSLLPEKVKGIPEMPLRSFDLLKRRFEIALKIKLEKEFESMMDKSNESKTQFIVNFIQDEIAFANRLLERFTETKKSTVPEFESQIIERKEIKIALKNYLEWLTKSIKSYRNKTLLENIVTSESFMIYEKEQLRICYKWQHVEPASLSNEQRFESDKQAYKETFHESAHSVEVEFNESYLIETLLSKMKKVKHPVWLSYKDWLISRQRQRDVKQEVTEPAQVSNRGIVNYSKYNHIFTDSELGMYLVKNWFDYIENKTSVTEWGYLWYKMKSANENLIHDVKQKVMFELLNDELEVSIDEFKTVQLSKQRNRDREYHRIKSDYTKKKVVR